MIGGRRHDTLVNRGASRVRERDIDMTTRQWFFVIALVAGAIVFVGFTLFQWLSPTQRALQWAKRGDSARAIDRLNALLERRPSSPAVHGTLGQVYLMAQRPHEAEAVLRKALALGKSERVAPWCPGMGLGPAWQARRGPTGRRRGQQESARGLRGLLSGLRADGAPRPGLRSGPALRFPQAKFDPAPEVESAGIPETSRCKVRVCPVDDERRWFRMSEIQGTRQESSTARVAFVPFPHEEIPPCRLHPV